MSRPVTEAEAATGTAETSHTEPTCVEMSESHEAVVGRIRMRRALPRRGRRTVRASCLADHMGPANLTENTALDAGPHPHIGLQTATWLVDGQMLHRDSLDTEQVIAPKQLNLMTPGGGLSRSEEATGHCRGRLEGTQLWVALPEASAHPERRGDGHGDRREHRRPHRTAHRRGA